MNKCRMCGKELGTAGCVNYACPLDIRQPVAYETQKAWNEGQRARDAEVAELRAECERLRGDVGKLAPKAWAYDKIVEQIEWLDKQKEALSPDRPTIMEALRASHAAGGNPWDAIADPEAFLDRKPDAPAGGANAAP